MDKPVEKILNDLRDDRFIHITKKDRILMSFNLTHGKGKRKRKKGRK